MIIPCLATYIYDAIWLYRWLLSAQFKPEDVGISVLFLFTQMKTTKICFLDD